MKMISNLFTLTACIGLARMLVKQVSHGLLVFCFLAELQIKDDKQMLEAQVSCPELSLAPVNLQLMVISVQ